MHYEIYVDMLFLLNFSMNLYLLELTNCILHHTATRRKVLLGAAVGAAVSVIPFFLPGEFMLMGGVGFVLSAVCMSLITFRAASFAAMLRILEIMVLLTVLIGAVLLYILRLLPENIQATMIVLLLMGGTVFMLVRFLISQKDIKNCECKVTLYSKKAKVKVNALIDTGNCLVEPISGEPVAFLDKNVFESLYLAEKPGSFRVIPYSSVDQKAGLLSGYRIPEVEIEWKGLCRVLRNIYVGVGQEELPGDRRYKMIINPDMLKERK